MTLSRARVSSGTLDSSAGSGRGLVGGVDGVRQGAWVMAVTGLAAGSPVEEFSVWTSFSRLWSHAGERGLLAVTVDIPIGLPSGGGRASDREARQILKANRVLGNPGRASSVFPAPPICTLGISDYQEALAMAKQQTGKGLSKQAFSLLPKIRDVREALKSTRDAPNMGPLDPRAWPRAAEVHPEVSFSVMNGDPMRFHKSRQAGVAERLVLLGKNFSNIVEKALLTGISTRPVSKEPGSLPVSPGLDDVLDAAAAAWTARRLVLGTAKRLGGCAADETGFSRSIWV